VIFGGFFFFCFLPPGLQGLDVAAAVAAAIGFLDCAVTRYVRALST